MRIFGLIGKKLSHSFSPPFFAEKFKNEGINDAQYLAFELALIEDFKQLLQQDHLLCGLNVTIPYKELIIPFLDEVDGSAKVIGAVNTIAFRTGKLIGFNTDVHGFEQSLLTSLAPLSIEQKNALILGTGGAAKAVEFVLKKLDWKYQYVSRNTEKADLTYSSLKKLDLTNFPLIINTTPLGMYPNVNSCPDLNYNQLSNKHLLYDLVYNPEETLFLKNGLEQGASIKNGLEMLHLQALKAWEIWNNP